jgi:hypothetical protein
MISARLWGFGMVRSSGPVQSVTAFLPVPTDDTPSGPAPRRAALVGRIVALCASVIVVMFLVIEIPPIARDFAAHPGSVGGDFTLYLDRTRAFLAGQGFYLERQLHGSYQWAVGDALYPPTAMLLFAPFLVLPAILWWALPIAIVGWVVWHHRPRPWAWPLILLCVAWPFTVTSVGFGNPVMWVSAFAALGTVYGWAAVLVLLKPSLAPFALIGIRTRRWWIALAIFGLVSLAFLPLWIEYVAVLRDGHLSIDYSLHDIPITMIGVVAWIAKSAPALDPEVVIGVQRVVARLPDRLQPRPRIVDDLGPDVIDRRA